MADPNVALIEGVILYKSASRIHGWLTGENHIEVTIDAIEYIMSGDWKSDLHKACIIDFCHRHGGITITNARRFIPSSFFGEQRTNKCNQCHLPGHNTNHCSSKLRSLAKQFGVRE